jgi:hypothetical protein
MHRALLELAGREEEHNMRPSGARRWTLFAVTLGLLHAAPAIGQDGVLYEAAENIRVTTGKISRRTAVAVLVGRVNAGTPWCPAALGRATCDITAIGGDAVNLATGKGPVTAAFTIVVQGDNPMDGPEFPVIRGTLYGQIDLSNAVLGADGLPLSGDEWPLGTMTGTWTARGDAAGPLGGWVGSGRLTGTFRLPFSMYGSPALYWTDAGAVPVAPDEQLLGSAMVRLEITFAP